MGKPAACHAEVPPATLQTRSLSKSSTCVIRTVAWADRRPDWQMIATCIKQDSSSQQRPDMRTAWWALTAMQVLRVWGLGSNVSNVQVPGRWRATPAPGASSH